MGRSIKKGPYVDEKLLKKVERMNRSGDRRPIKTWSRRSMVIPDFVGHTMAIHNGKQHISISLPRTWLGIGWVNSRQRESSGNTACTPIRRRQS